MSAYWHTRPWLVREKCWWLLTYLVMSGYVRCLNKCIVLRPALHPTINFKRLTQLTVSDSLLPEVPIPRHHTNKHLHQGSLQPCLSVLQ